MIQDERLLTQKEAAERLTISLQALRHLRRARKLNFFRLGHRTVRIAESEIERYLARNERLRA